jgi:hypothetical protein
MAQFDSAAIQVLPPALHAAVPLCIFELYERSKHGIEPWEVEGYAPLVSNWLPKAINSSSPVAKKERRAACSPGWSRHWQLQPS